MHTIVAKIATARVARRYRLAEQSHQLWEERRRASRRGVPGARNGLRIPSQARAVCRTRRHQAAPWARRRRAASLRVRKQTTRRREKTRGEAMSPLTKSNNLAARMGRWSASHWKTAVFGWLAFVVAVLVIGQMVGTK